MPGWEPGRGILCCSSVPGKYITPDLGLLMMLGTLRWEEARGWTGMPVVVMPAEVTCEGERLIKVMGGGGGGGRGRGSFLVFLGWRREMGRFLPWPVVSPAAEVEEMMEEAVETMVTLGPRSCPA